MSDIPKKTYIPIGCLVAMHVYPPRPLASGLLLPENSQGAKYEAQRCLVIAVGPDCKWVKEGDEVLCVNPAQGIIHDGNRTALIREENLVGVVVPTEEKLAEMRREYKCVTCSCRRRFGSRNPQPVMCPNCKCVTESVPVE